MNRYAYAFQSWFKPLVLLIAVGLLPLDNTFFCDGAAALLSADADALVVWHVASSVQA